MFGGSGKSFSEEELVLSRMYHRRRKGTVIVLVLILAFGYYLWATYLSGRIILLQQASVEEITRGKIFGPFYIKSGAKTIYSFKVRKPISIPAWETRIEILNENLQVIHPQTDLILSGSNAFGENYSKRTSFKLRDSGKYFIRFQQTNGTYEEEIIGSEPIMVFIIKSDIVDGWMLWLPLISAAFVVLALLVLW